MTTEFEFFEGTATVQSTSPRVTLRKSGQLVLTQAAVEMLGEDVEAVQIGFNAKTQTIGLRPAPKDAHGALKLRKQPNGRSRLVDAKRFFAHHGVTVENALRLEVEDFGSGVVGFRLPGEPGEANAPTQEVKRRTGNRRTAAS